MFDFLQGLAFGLLMSVMPWFLTGLYDPRLVVPEELASRWQVILRYALVMPTVAMSPSTRIHSWSSVYLVVMWFLVGDAAFRSPCACRSGARRVGEGFDRLRPDVSFF